jgi:hypothetical protein
VLVNTAVSCHVILCLTNNATHPCRLLATSHCASGRSCVPPSRHRVPLVLLSPTANAQSLPKSTLHCIHLSQASLTQLHNFCPNAALPTSSTFCNSDALLPSVEHSPLSTSPLLNALPCFQLTFIRRTSRHCLRIFKAVKIYVPRPVYLSFSLIFPVC